MDIRVWQQESSSKQLAPKLRGGHMKLPTGVAHHPGEGLGTLSDHVRGAFTPGCVFSIRIGPLQVWMDRIPPRLAQAQNGWETGPNPQRCNLTAPGLALAGSGGPVHMGTTR